MTSKCPKCENKNLRHKGKQIREMIEYKLRRPVYKAKWTEEGYYCKRCGYEGDGK